MSMVLTILEARVAPENWSILEAAYRSGVDDMPPQLSQTYLVQSSSDPDLWRILSLWHSLAELEEMRSNGTPAGVLMFRTAGAEPKLLVFDVRSSMIANKALSEGR